MAGQQTLYSALTLGKPNALVSIKITHHPFASFIDKEGVSANPSVFDSGIAGKNLGIDVAEDHLCGGVVVPRHEPVPHPGFVLQQRPQMLRAEVPQIQDLYSGRLRHPVCFDVGVQAHVNLYGSPGGESWDEVKVYPSTSKYAKITFGSGTKAVGTSRVTVHLTRALTGCLDDYAARLPITGSRRSRAITAILWSSIPLAASDH